MIDWFDRALSVFDIIACIADFAVIYYFLKREKRTVKKPFASRIMRRPVTRQRKALSSARRP
jgi:hypothetical protein